MITPTIYIWSDAHWNQLSFKHNTVPVSLIDRFLLNKTYGQRLMTANIAK